MKSLTGNFSPVRGWVLLLALLLGAGMMISACGDEEVPAPTTPEPPPAPPPAPEPEPEPEPGGLGVPMNLRVTDRGAGSITWTWDAVEGASLYQAQFSENDTFVDGEDPVNLVIAPRTSFTANNVSGGYLRVQAVGGTVAEPVLSGWSDPVSGAAAAATPLSSPADLTAGDTTETSVALSWSEVSDADSYEVEYRVDGAGGSWNEADCDDSGSGTVEDTSCTVTDLDASTDYEFRVRAVPADDDVVNAASAWSDIDAGTEGARETMTPGGMGDLNVTWKADGNVITFSWDPMAGAEYEWATPAGDMDDTDPCDGATFDDLTTAPAGTGARFDADVTVNAAGTSAGLCVRTTDEDNRATSFAWGISEPMQPTVGATTLNDDMDTATSLGWTGIEVKDGFEWELRLVSDPGRGNGEHSGAPDDDLQKACSAGTFVDQGEADLDLSFNYTWDGSIDAYSGYTLCLRYANTAGMTDWAVPLTGTDLNEIQTPPARPPSPQYSSSRSSTSANGNERTLVWTVGVRDLNNVPRTEAGFEAKTISYLVRYDHDGVDTTGMVTTPAPTSCEEGDITDGPANLNGGSNPWTATAATDANDLEGIAVTSTNFTIPENASQNLGVRLCVRATQNSAGTTLNGPWVLSSVTSIPKKSS